MRVIADDRQMMQIWSFMLEKGMLSEICIKDWYFSNLSWSNIHLESHNLNHVFFKIGFEKADMNHPTKQACATAGVPDDVLTRKRKISSDSAQQNHRKRPRNIVSQLRAKYIARQTAKRKKLAALGYPADSAEEEEAIHPNPLQSDYEEITKQQQTDKPVDESPNNDGNNANNADLDGENDIADIHIDKESDENEDVDVENNDGDAKSDAYHDVYIDDDYSIQPPCSSRTADWVNKSPEPMEYNERPSSKRSDNESEGDEPETDVTVKHSSQSSPVAGPSNKTNIIVPDDSNVTKREKTTEVIIDEKRQSGISDFTSLSDATSVDAASNDNLNAINLMSTQELIDYSPSYSGSVYGADENAQTGNY